MSSYQRSTSKPRSKVVAPILRKLVPSEKNSLDLDRPMGEQDGVGIYHYNGNPRTSHDLITTYEHHHGSRRGYHQRSTSGTSQFSTGSFVHPFQQTPRPYTPPLTSGASYQTSLRESEPSPILDDSPYRKSNLTSRAASLTHTPGSIGPPPLRIQTKNSSSRLALTTSHSSLHNNTSDHSPTCPNDLVSPADTMSPLSQTIRSSVDKGFRLRSRSDLDRERDRPLTIQEARRKFHEKEQAKEERAARDEIRALEKRNAKEARQIERAHGQRRSSTSAETVPSKRARSKSDLTMRTDEKSDPLGFVGKGYESVPEQAPPYAVAGLVGPGMIGTSRSTTKKKTHGAWTKLMMWLRTRFIRMGRKKDD